MNEIQGVAYQYDSMTDERIDELIVTYTNGTISAVPIDELNKQYREVLKWVEDGGEIDE
jgi:low affinity Fe/Cu permease